MLIPVFDQQVRRYVVPDGLAPEEQRQFCACASIVEEAMIASTSTGSVLAYLPNVSRHVVIQLAKIYSSIGLFDDFTPIGDGKWLFVVKV